MKKGKLKRKKKHFDPFSDKTFVNLRKEKMCKQDRVVTTSLPFQQLDPFLNHFFSDIR